MVAASPRRLVLACMSHSAHGHLRAGPPSGWADVGADRWSLEADGGPELGGCAAGFLLPPALTTEVATLGLPRGDRGFYVSMGRGSESWLEISRAGVKGLSWVSLGVSKGLLQGAASWPPGPSGPELAPAPFPLVP